MTTDEQYMAIRAALANILAELQRHAARLDDIALDVRRAIDVAEQSQARSLVAHDVASTALERASLVTSERPTEPELRRPSEVPQ